MKHVIQHTLDAVQSRRMAEKAFAHYEKRFAKYEPAIRWTDERHAQFAFKAKGVSLSGTMELRPGALEIDLDVPFLFRMFRAPAIRILEEEVKRLLAESSPKTQAGEATPL